MKQNHLMSLLQNDFTTIGVAFRADIDAANKAPMPAAFDSTRKEHKPTPRLFDYKSPLNQDVKVDDFVVVEGPKGGPMVGLVYRVDEVPNINPDADFDYKWIVQKIDMGPYQERLKAESEFLETMREVERESQKADLIDKFKAHLPDGSPARQKLDAAIANLNKTPQLK